MVGDGLVHLRAASHYSRGSRETVRLSVQTLLRFQKNRLKIANNIFLSFFNEIFWQPLNHSLGLYSCLNQTSLRVCRSGQILGQRGDNLPLPNGTLGDIDIQAIWISFHSAYCLYLSLPMKSLYVSVKNGLKIIDTQFFVVTCW